MYDKILAQNSEFLNSLGIPGINYIVALGLIILVMFLTKITMQVLGIIQGVMTATIVPKIIMKMKSQVFQSMGELSISFFNSRQTGGLMTRVLRDAERVTGFFIDGLPYLMINLLTIIATAIVMFQMNWRLALAALIFVPIIFTISFRLMPKLWHFYGRNNLGVKRIFATCNEKNVASYKVMEKCNMVKIKTENDHKSYRHGEPVTFNRLIYCIER